MTIPYYATVLSDELARRKQKNPRYSMRAFAKYMELDPSAMSRVLKGKQDLSLPNCLKIAKKLTLTQSQRGLFLASVAEDKMKRAADVLARAIDLPLPLSLGQRPESDSNYPSPETILSYSPDYITVMNPEGRYLYANPRTAVIVGTSAADMIGKTAQELGMDAELLALIQRQLDEVLKTGEISTAETIIRCKDQEFHCERQVTPILGQNGKVEAVFASIRDISQRKKVEQEREKLFDRLTRLQQITLSLSQTLSAEEVAAVVMNQIIAALSAHSGSLFIHWPEENCLKALNAGVNLAAVPPYETMQLSQTSAHTEACITKKSIWMPDFEDFLSIYPHLHTLMKEHGFRSGAVIPLMVDENVIGTLGIRFTRVRAFLKDEREFIETIARLCAQALERARLFDTEKVACIPGKASRRKMTVA